MAKVNSQQYKINISLLFLFLLFLFNVLFKLSNSTNTLNKNKNNNKASVYTFTKLSKKTNNNSINNNNSIIISKKSKKIDISDKEYIVNKKELLSESSVMTVNKIKSYLKVNNSKNISDKTILLSLNQSSNSTVNPSSDSFTTNNDASKPSVYEYNNKTYIQTYDCKKNCSSRGVCLNSTCFCDQGFTSEFCENTTKNKAVEGYPVTEYIVYFIVTCLGAFILTGIIIFIVFKKNK